MGDLADQIPAASPSLSGDLEAVVHRVDDGGVYVRLVAGGQRYVTGPCAHPGGSPPAGTRCLVRRSDRRRWWIVTFDGWTP